MRLHVTIPPREHAYCLGRARAVGGVPDVLIEAVRDVRTLFDLPPDQLAVLEVERTRLTLEQRDYMRLLLSRRYQRLVAEGRHFTHRPSPITPEQPSRTSVYMPLSEAHYLARRASVMRTTQAAIIGAVSDILSFYDLPPDQYELLSSEWATLAHERFDAPSFDRREYLRFCVSEHFQLLRRESPAEDGTGVPRNQGGGR